MIAPSKVDVWFAEAVQRVFEPWLTSATVAERYRREVARLIDEARRVACMPPLGSCVGRAAVRRSASGRFGPWPGADTAVDLPPVRVAGPVTGVRR